MCLDEFESLFWKFAEDVRALCYMTRAYELQEEAWGQARHLEAEARRLKNEVIEANDELNANRLLALECMCEMISCELAMWLAFKDDRMSDAWDALVAAQCATRDALQAHEIASHLENYAERLYAVEKILFPPQLFFSVGVTVKKATCSICGLKYEECDHIIGKPYMGRLCGRRIEECDLQEVSIVPEPADKRCRAIIVSGRDSLTWREVDEPEQGYE